MQKVFGAMVVALLTAGSAFAMPMEGVNEADHAFFALKGIQPAATMSDTELASVVGQQINVSPGGLIDITIQNTLNRNDVEVNIIRNADILNNARVAVTVGGTVIQP